MVWLARQAERQLPGRHFMLTFTVPEALRPFLRAHQRDGYSALFAASSAAIKTLARNPRHSSRRKLHTNLHHPIVIARRATRQRRAPWQPRDASPANQATSLNCHVATLLATTNQWVTRLVHREAGVAQETAHGP